MPGIHNTKNINLLQDLRDSNFTVQNTILNMKNRDFFSDLSEPCLNFINDSLKDLESRVVDPTAKLNSELTNMLKLSGKFPGDLGKFVSCDNIDNMKYYFGML